ncbi:multidrug transporter [Brenneria goodwinii]|uniref:Multidrug transporter n=1 Tax=Brenneria goodwinii TaxID=1109412 RepID=A0A0G4JR42_9GAMM|nr:MFS transporter [Brenneria goodwinii]ATA25158.1 multidrug transporter [Brenneria goodwinii]MCG8157924.1 MFS transporter [Brenneria goodwinii]MCG8163551.1 MFS transporter [Brenneria goodwinii]MCG8168108.1 MFS transporter [Brenneria goodwinii]MCG8172687.1 MFS transporter [Brenneria goodwinii]
MNTSWVLFWIASITFFMQSLDTTMLYIAIPAIADSLHQPVLHMEMIVISYVITVVAFTPVNGWLAERFGEKKTYLLAIGIFMLGSLLCITANSVISLSAFRFIQGIGGALMLPIIRTVILRTTPQAMKLIFLNRITLLGLLGTMVGPLLGSVLVNLFSWRIIFIANIPLSLVCLLLAAKHIPNETLSIERRADPYGLVLMVLMLFMTAFTLTAMPKNIISTPVALLLCLSGTGLAFLYFKRDITRREALFPAELFEIKTFSIGILGGILTRVLLSSTPVVLSLMLQTTLDCKPVETSIILLLFSTGALLSKVIFEPMIKRAGYRKLLMVTTGFTSLFILAMSFAVQEKSMMQIGIIAAILGILISTLHSAESTLAFSNLSNSTYNSGNNVLTITQLISVMVSMALTFPVLRFLSHYEVVFKLNSFSLLFLLLGIGLPICCLVFKHLNEEDGHHFIHGR